MDARPIHEDPSGSQESSCLGERRPVVGRTRFFRSRDFFCIRDDCTTELLPDEGREDCFIAIGYRPMEEERLRPVMKKFELYR